MSTDKSDWTGSERQSGFTLVELLVSIAIFTLITTIAVFNHAQFNSSILLTDLAYEAALTIRQAQVYGITVRQSSTNGYDSGYGVHFQTNDPTTYKLFEDMPTPNHICDSTECSSPIESYTIQKGNQVTRLCADGDCTKTSLDISFIRPNPDAFITANGVGTLYNEAVICLKSPQGIARRAIVESTGQISVDNDPTNVCQ